LGKLADLELVDSIAFFFLRQKLANLNAALGFGWNDQREAATLRTEDVRVTKRPYINFGELVCQRVGVSASWLSASWTVGQLDCLRVRLSASCLITASK